MIPRFKPHLNAEELKAAFAPQEDAVQLFEAQFAKTFESHHAIAFPYGRSALWTFFKAMGLKKAEIVIPAYTCSVVAHAVVLSGNIPRFVDISLRDYNMDLDLLTEVINERTRAIVPTHLFGYPLDVDRLAEIVGKAEKQYGHKIWVIQDCAHAFGARWKGRLVCNEGDLAIFGLNISKLITSIFGGMLTTVSDELAGPIRAWRDQYLRKPPSSKAWRRRFYLTAVYAAFNERNYGVINWLAGNTSLLDSLTKAYHLDEKIHFPPDHDEEMTAPEASVGLIQLKKYRTIVQERCDNAHYYFQALQGIPGLELPPLVEGATYSHFTIRVPDRANLLKYFLSRGIELGELIQYSLPHMKMYRDYISDPSKYPNSLRCSESAVNLPVYRRLPSSSLAELVHVVGPKH